MSARSKKREVAGDISIGPGFKSRRPHQQYPPDRGACMQKVALKGPLSLIKMDLAW